MQTSFACKAPSLVKRAMLPINDRHTSDLDRYSISMTSDACLFVLSDMNQYVDNSREALAKKQEVAKLILEKKLVLNKHVRAQEPRLHCCIYSIKQE